MMRNVLMKYFECHINIEWNRSKICNWLDWLLSCILRVAFIRQLPPFTKNSETDMGSTMISAALASDTC